MSLVVSDTSPIRALHFLGQIDLLHQIFGTVVIPPAVAGELTQPRAPYEPIDASNIAFVEIREPHDDHRVREYMITLDAGEAEALVLAIELRATLLIDEIEGRAAAAAAGVPFIGVLGVLARAKRDCLIDEVRPLLDRLRGELRFRIAQPLFDQFLHSIGE